MLDRRDTLGAPDAPHPVPDAHGAGRAQYLLFGEALKRLPGSAFELHDHPAAVLDLATGPLTRVWGWWTRATGERPAVPCILWVGELGWGATAVEPDIFDSEGYERSFWSHRIKLLDLAVANALGPFPALEDLQRQVIADFSFGPGADGADLAGALLWGILQQKAAQARLHAGTVEETPVLLPELAIGGVVDDDLAARQLGPDVAKVRLEHGDRGLMGLLQAVNDVPAERRHGWSLPAWRAVLPRLHRAGSQQSA